uniref:Uncharacterized protein n=1 Tax=Ananas comosus var. bracteatus TaxID=296719 RepID=A0A6V7Q6Z6_ANACO|nr:unnamed protein product [Ananas comosus var. bracteatus]
MLLQQTLLLLPKPSSPLPFPPNPNPNPKPSPLLSISSTTPRLRSKPSPPSASSSSSATSDPIPNPDPNPKPNPKKRRSKPKAPPETTGAGEFPSTIPRKPRRGRRSEAAAVEDFVRDRLERTFAAIREKNAGVLEGKEEEVLKSRDESIEEEEEKNQVVVEEEEDPDWPLDADIGGDGGRVGEGDQLLGVESFAFHPSPLVVLVFERYKRAADNWKLLKELEKAAKVYWSAKDRLPPRTVKIDINIETDLAYALKVKECPQLLFLKGNKILYREKEMRSAEELVQMIAHFYYNAKRPSWVDATAVAPPF